MIFFFFFWLVDRVCCTFTGFFFLLVLWLFTYLGRHLGERLRHGSMCKRAEGEMKTSGSWLRSEDQRVGTKGQLYHIDVRNSLLPPPLTPPTFQPALGEPGQI